MKNSRSGAKPAKRSRSKNGTSGQPDIMSLPIAIMLDVFFRLPLVCIMACKRVCKSWHEALKSPEFTNGFGAESPFTRFILHNAKPHLHSGCPFSLIETSENGDCFQTPTTLKIPGRIRNPSPLTVVGSCRGVLCVKLQSNYFTTIYVTNPMTGECKELLAYECQPGSYNKTMFGFSSLRNCFKVISVDVKSRGGRLEGKSRSCRVGVDRYWRESTPLPIMSNADTGNIFFVNEFFHWIGYDFAHTLRINTFDIGKETLGRISQPHGVELNMHNTHLGVLGDHLCLVERKLNPGQTRLWTLREHGWTQDFALRFPFQIMPMSLSKQGNIILKHLIYLMSLNSNLTTCFYFETFTWSQFTDYTNIWVAFDPSFLSLGELEYVESSDDSDQD